MVFSKINEPLSIMFTVYHWYLDLKKYEWLSEPKARTFHVHNGSYVIAYIKTVVYFLKEIF